MKSLERPRISPSSKSKVAVGVRQMRLDMIIEECLKLYPDKADAYQRVCIVNTLLKVIRFSL